MLFQPIAAEDVARAVGRVAVGAPLNGVVEIGGPEQFRFDEFIRLGLAPATTPVKWSPTRTPATSAPELSERMLVPDDDARLGEITFENWLATSVPQTVHA